MTFLAILVLLAAHYVSGNGLLHLFKVRLKPSMQITLSIICGICILSLVPVILEMAFIPITLPAVATAIGVVCLLLNIPRLINFRSEWKGFHFQIPTIKAYEIPFFLLFAFIFFSTLWRSYYLPSNARDMLSGPEVLAHYAVREHTLINSVLSVNLESTNNHVKPPFILGLQVIYKLFGIYFGGVWVGLLSVCFYIFLYNVLREKVHGVIAGALLLLFLALPEVYAYSYMMLFDYSNMALFFAGVYFMLRYFKSRRQSEMYFSALLFGFSTLIRLETLVLVAMMVPLLWIYAYQKKTPVKTTMLQTIALGGFSVFFYVLWMNIYLKFYMPGLLTVESQMNPNLADLSPLFKRFREMNSELLFGRLEEPLWGHFIKVFLAVMILDLIINRRMSRESLNWLYAFAVVYFGLPLLGYMLPLMDLANTTKRGLFKLMPLALLLMANTTLLIKLSTRMSAWETETEEDRQRAATAKKAAKQQPKAKLAKR